MELNVKYHDKCVRFEPNGIIDKKGAEVLKRRFEELDITELEKFVLDLGKVGYICGSGVGSFLTFYKKMTSKGGKLFIENDTGLFLELLTITKMDTTLNVYGN